MAFIERLDVEGGFLNGLGLSFEPGLNVLIGPRGVGKTSVVELLRFCLGVRGFTEESDRASRTHALSILGDGQVSVTLISEGESVLLTRSADDDSPRPGVATEMWLPTILSQREIELVGRDAGGRLRLIDGFRNRIDDLDRSDEALRASIASVTEEMHDIARELDALSQQTLELAEAPVELENALATELELKASMGDRQDEETQVQKLGTQIADLGVQIGIGERTIEALKGWRVRLDQTLSAAPVLEDWPAPQDALQAARQTILQAGQALKATVAQIQETEADLALAVGVLESSRVNAQQEARPLRKQLEEIQRGAGALSRRVADLRERVGQLEALQGVVNTKLSQIESLQSSRRELLDQLDEVRLTRFAERDGIAARLNALLGPDIDVSVERAGLHTEFAAAIAASLRGSGLHYNTLAPLLAQSMSPRELCEAVENGDAATIARLGEIADERAERAIAHLRVQGVTDIVTSPISDAVTLSLLDGAEYKSTEEVSTGQRCTVVLPILLSQTDHTLVIDQPEDHLDNSFIVETVISSLRSIGSSGQMIFSTHNANIPVLGDAARVILLGSDGQRGFERLSGPLLAPDVVEAITEVMEGGRDAFRQRAAFYDERLPQQVS